MEGAGRGEGEDAAEEGVGEADDAGGGLGLEDRELGDDGVGGDGCGGGCEVGNEEESGDGECGGRDRHCDGGSEVCLNQAETLEFGGL